MVMPKEMKDKMRNFTLELTKQIQDINGDPKLAGHEKALAIGNLKGISKQDAFDFLNKNFRTGMGLHGNLAKYVSEGRPRGAPKDSATGTKKKGFLSR